MSKEAALTAMRETAVQNAEAPGGAERYSYAREQSFVCADGYVLSGHIWSARGRDVLGRVIINPATGVLARYYHAYAEFLSRQGFDVLTYDYRGIGRSRPTSLKSARMRWRDWGELDFEAVLQSMARDGADHPVIVVGHSIGGFLAGFAPSADRIDRMLTVGAQYAYWRDYAPHARLGMLAKWHLAMPLITAAFGYFPGRRLGWLEDLPAGVAFEWAFRRRRMEWSYPAADRAAVLGRFSRLKGEILAVGLTDDVFAPPEAIARGLSYFTNARRTQALLAPSDLGQVDVGHFGFFHARHSAGVWLDTLLWLRDGRNPWPKAVHNGVVQRDFREQQLSG